MCEFFFVVTIFSELTKCEVFKGFLGGSSYDQYQLSNRIANLRKANNIFL